LALEFVFIDIDVDALGAGSREYWKHEYWEMGAGRLRARIGSTGSWELGAGSQC
jgi:hypothetical protein